MQAKIVYGFDDVMRLIADDLRRQGFSQAASGADDRHSVRVLGHAKYAGSELQEVSLREIQVNHWIEAADAASTGANSGVDNPVSK